MGNTPFKMKGFGGFGSPMRKDEVKKPKVQPKVEKVVKGKTYDTVEVSGGKAPTFDEKNTVMTKTELRDAKINPKKGTKYYKNIKTGKVSTIDWSKK